MLGGPPCPAADCSCPVTYTSRVHSSEQSSSSRLTFPSPATTISPATSPSKLSTERPLITSSLPSWSRSTAKDTGPVYRAPPMPSEPTHSNSPVLLYTRLPSRISTEPSPSRSASEGPPHSL